jgi:hypothetical protein
MNIGTIPIGGNQFFVLAQMREHTELNLGIVRRKNDIPGSPGTNAARIFFPSSVRIGISASSDHGSKTTVAVPHWRKLV